MRPFGETNERASFIPGLAREVNAFVPYRSEKFKGGEIAGI